jgi:SNF2 family DNA or RNA helicase
MWPFKMKPLPVQTKALEKAKGKPGYGFFLEPGMGKTAIIMAEFTELAKKDAVDLLVVVCPNTLRSNWEAEAYKFGFKYEVSIFPKAAPKKGMWIVNYEKLVTDGVEKIYDTIVKRKTYMVCDESHRIKNPKAKSTRAAIALFDKCVVKRVMTGTPMANNVVDLWPQVRSIGHHGIHNNQFTWRNRYGIMGGWMGKVVVGVQREDELKMLLDECSFQAKKKEWMSTLPPKAYYTLGYEMTKNQLKAYRDIYEERFLSVNDQEVTAQIVITVLMKMQQITSGFTIDDNGEIIDLVGSKNPKMLAVEDALQDIEGKVIMFAHYRHTIDMLYSRFGANAVKIVGGMKREDIEAAKNAFNNDDSVQYLIAQTSTAKEGLTLLGSDANPCHTTIFVENTYSLIDRTQAEDRNHRHGQKADQVSYYDLAGSDTDARIVRALQGKRDLVQTVMEGRR